MKSPLLLAFLFLSCAQPEPELAPGHFDTPPEIVLKTGAERMELYLPLLDNRKVGLIANATSQVNGVHLVDTLLARGIEVDRVFAPEHGFRGDKSDGAKVKNQVDPKTGIPILSVYGSTKKPTPDMLEGLDILIFDIQDVGVRCYTYISTMHLCMEAAADAGIPFMVLDRPNPNGFYVDGPVMQERHFSFVGMHPIPLVHGLTVGELAGMIRGEKWLDTEREIDLTVVQCEGWGHEELYELPVAPSPNLPTLASVYLYPSLVLLEATATTVGRGTDKPFQRAGYPGHATGTSSFTPQSIPGVSTFPKYEGKLCTGFDALPSDIAYTRDNRTLDMHWLVDMHASWTGKDAFFNRSGFFDQLSGTGSLRRAIEGDLDIQTIRATWQTDLESYLKLRKAYLLYSDFE